MTEAIEVVVGLGNPGPRYAAHRHNIGFWFVDRAASCHAGQFRRSGRFLGDVAEVSDRGRPFRLLKPETYMNHSGQSVAALLNYYRLTPQQLLVVHDDLDLPPGTARLKQGGGHGGHNGLRHIMAQLGSRDFVRLRLGIGRPTESDEVVGYVLKPPMREEQPLIEEAMENALKQLPQILAGEFDLAMNALHTKR